MTIQTSCVMKPIKVEQKAISRYLLTRIVGTSLPNIENFLRVYVRLIDKAVSEYNESYNLIVESIKEAQRPVKELEKGRILYAPYIINELENCILTTNRIMNIFEKLTSHKDTPFYIEKILRRHIGAIGGKLRSVRNIIEHIDNALLTGEIEQGKSVTLDISEDASVIKIGNLELQIADLASLLKNLNEIALEIVIYNATTTYEKKFKIIIDKQKNDEKAKS